MSMFGYQAFQDIPVPIYPFPYNFEGDASVLFPNFSII